MRRVTLSTDRDLVVLRFVGKLRSFQTREALVVLSAVQWRFGFVVKVVGLNDNDNDNGISNEVWWYYGFVGELRSCQQGRPYGSTTWIVKKLRSSSSREMRS